jgi:hypothetical protein
MDRLTQTAEEDPAAGKAEIDLDRREQDTLLVSLSGSWKIGSDAPAVEKVLKHLKPLEGVRKVAFESSGITGWICFCINFSISKFFHLQAGMRHGRRHNLQEHRPVKRDQLVAITNTHKSKEAQMKISAIIFLLTLSGLASAASENDFKAETTEQIINLCTATPDDPLYQQAVNFCHGYLVGAYDYYEAAFAGGGGTKRVCFPDPPPSRNDAIEMFLEWAKAHPQYMQDRPVDTEFRFLEEKFPCNP